jgi:hypothetical protein
LPTEKESVATRTLLVNSLLMEQDIFAIGTGNYFGSRELPKLGSRKINWDGIFTLAARGVRVLAQHKMQASCMP